MPLRPRAKLVPVSLVDHFSRLREWERDPTPVNRESHKRLHRPITWVYSTKKTLDTSAGVPFYPLHYGRIVRVRLSVTTAPTSTLTGDILLNGTTIFTSGVDPNPTIAATLNSGIVSVQSLAHFIPDDKIQCQLTATGGATGPCIFQIEAEVNVI